LRTGFEALRLKSEIEVDETYVSLGFKGQVRAKPRSTEVGCAITMTNLQGITR